MTKSEKTPPIAISNRAVPDPPMRPLNTFVGVVAAVKVTRAFPPVTMMLAVVAVRSDAEESRIAPLVAETDTAEVVVLDVVTAVAPKLTFPAEAAKVIVPASVLRLVTFKCPVAAVNEKLIPELCTLVRVSWLPLGVTVKAVNPNPASKSIV